MIFIYVSYVPVTFYEWIWSDGGTPYTAFLLGVAIPLIRVNHIRDIRRKEEESSM
ncbi:hypothetical protein [Lentibacillus sp. JNUCC-1]|uniref:hypothetical protein n=1 Tax=Lentibacillus sp. JNUCC-1 TaxID=2654513 RepID=UPI001E314D38|nr:hypothetical protein [Lentibacillus sp. JNUCC-1]